ncbi:MAG: hypothetical protein RI963_2065 [Planctomycetota bacterium]
MSGDSFFSICPSVLVYDRARSFGQFLIDHRSHRDRLAGRRGSDAVDVIAATVRRILLDQPVDIGVKAGEFFVEASCEAKVLDDRLVEAFPGDEEWDAGGIGCKEDAGDPSFEVVDFDAIDFAADHHVVSVGRLHRRLRDRQVHFGRDPRDVVFAVGAVDLVAEVAEADVLVLGILLGKFGEDPPELLVLVVIVLELLQGAEEGVPPALGDADREHDEKRVEPSLFDDNAVLGEVTGDDRGWDPGFGKAAADIKPGGNDCCLDRVEHVEAIGQRAEAMPTIFGAEDPIFAFADAIFGDGIGAPDLEPPVFAEFLVNLPHRAAEIECFEDRFLDQGGAAGGFHHGGGDIARGDDRVLWGSRGVHQIGLVEAATIELREVRFLHQDLRGLRNPGEEFVGRVGGEDHRVFATRAVLTDGVEVAIEIVERGVGEPGFIEMECPDVLVEQRFEFFDVVDHPIVGALCDRQDPRFAIGILGLGLAGEGVRVDFFLNVVGVEFVERDRADQSQVVAGWGEENGDRAGHDDGVEDRFVAVPVDDDDVP